MTQIQLSAAQIAEIARTLKSAREAKKEDIADIAYRIALSPSQLRAIESENTAPFYSHHYFLQAAARYANALNIVLPNTAAKEVVSEKVTQETNVPHGQENTKESIQETAQENPKPIIQSAELTSTSSVLSERTSVVTPDVIPVVTSARPAATGSESVSKAQKPLPKKQPQVIQVGQPAAGKKTLRWAWVGFASLIAILLGVIKIGLQDNPQTLVADAAKSTAAMSNAAPAANAPVSPEKTPTQNQSQNQSPSQNPAPPAVLAPAPAAAASALANNTPAALGNGESDSYIRSKAPTWLQIVATSGEKTNLRIGPDEQINFVAAKTAAVVFGRPDAASVYVRGNRVDLEPFIEDPDRRRALVIMREVR